MLVAIHQPEFLPWAGLFEKMSRADLFVVLDDVQFSKNDYQNRTRVKGQAGAQWLTVPVAHKTGQPINEVEVSGDAWRAKHWKTLVSCYARAPHFREYAPAFEELYSRPWARLAELNVAALDLAARALGIEKKWAFSSGLKAGGRKSGLVLNICERVGATRYYSGRTGSTYLDRDEFARAGIEIVVQEFKHPTYEQLFMKEAGFVAGLSIVDMLFNCGPSSRELLTRQ